MARDITTLENRIDMVPKASRPLPNFFSEQNETFDKVDRKFSSPEAEAAFKKVYEMSLHPTEVSDRDWAIRRYRQLPQVNIGGASDGLESQME